jgi:hypothetical protein
MATEREGRTTVIDRRGGGMGAILGVAIVALIALVAVFLVVNANRNDPGQQVADAATSIAGSASRAADAAGDAASGAATSTADAAGGAARSTTDAVTPDR